MIKIKDIEIFSSEEAAQQDNCSLSTSRNWAAKNNVKFIKIGRRKIFLWIKENIDQFKKRDKIPGRRYPKK